MNEAGPQSVRPEVNPGTALASTVETRSPQERFARLYIERGFRLAEAAIIMEISLAEAQRMLLHDVEVMSHLDRLVTTGEAAITVAGPRETMEAITSAIRYSKKEYYGECATLGIKPDPIAFWRLKIDAAMSRYKIEVGARRARKRPTTPAEIIREILAK